VRGDDRRPDAGYGKSTGPPSDAAGRSADISVVFLVCYRGRLKRPHLHCRADAGRNYGYQHPAAETSAPAAPYHLDTPLSFVLRRQCIWYAGHGCGEANMRSTDSKRGVTGDYYPAHSMPYCRTVTSLENRFSEVEKFLSRDREKD